MSTRSFVRFPSTHWSWVLMAAGDDPDVRRQALDKLARRYIRPLRAHLVRWRHVTPDRAEDLVQEFLLSKVIEQHLLGSADRRRGKFRTFLLGAMQKFVADQLRFDARPLRAGVLGATSLQDVREPVDGNSDPQLLFDADCARQALEEALTRMRAECAGDRADIWAVFEARLLAPMYHSTDPPAHEKLARQLKLESAEQSANRLITAKRMFYRMLRAVVAEHAGSEADVEQEIADLQAALSRTGRGIKRIGNV